MSDLFKPVQVTRQDSYKFSGRPLIPFLLPTTSTMKIPTHFNRATLDEVVNNTQRQCYGLPKSLDVTQDKGTQTDYRESEVQTSPWEPPYKVQSGHSPEILTLAHLTWKHGLPAGKHEVEIVNRMRMRRAWEAILPPMDSSANIKTRIAIISALEADDWAFREAEIQFIMDIRMKLMEKLMQARDKQRNEKIQERFKKLEESLEKRREKEVRNIRRKLGRELRKLAVKHNQNRKSKRYQKCNVIEQHADAQSELYAPQMRFGENPQRRHEILRKRLLKENYIDNAEKEDTMPSWLPTYEELKAIGPKPKLTELCIRETRWNEEKLRQLHADLKAIRLNLKTTETMSSTKRKYKVPPLPPTPSMLDTQNVEHELDRASLFIQKTIRGRAIQCMMFEGRDRCRELIEELQSTHALQEHTRKSRQKEKNHTIELQQDQHYKNLQENSLCEILNSLEGMTVSGMLDYLSKELIRLYDERRAHAFALIAERERNKREAAEAGRRQLERNRRRELDEMFRQMMKVNQDSVEVYLEDIIKENIDWVSDEQAKEYISGIADKAEMVSRYAADSATELMQEEMVSDMIYNFVLPDVEKQIVRKRMRERQQVYLESAHAAIYDETLKLSPEERFTPSVMYPKEKRVGQGGEETPLFEEETEEVRRETSKAWITNRIVTDQIVDPVFGTAVLTDNEEMVRNLLENIVSEAVTCDQTFQNTSSESSGSSYSSSCSSKSDIS